MSDKQSAEQSCDVQPSGWVMLREGGFTPPSRPVSGTPSDHVPNYPDNPAHSILANGTLTCTHEAAKITASLTAEHSMMHHGIAGTGKPGDSQRVTAEFAVEPQAGMIDKTLFWHTRRVVDFDAGADRNIYAAGVHVIGNPVNVTSTTKLAFGGGVRKGTMDPAIAQLHARMSHGATFVGGGVIESLDNRNDQAFIEAGYTGKICNGMLRHYVDTEHTNPVDNSRTQWDAGYKLSEKTSGYSYGTIAQGNDAQLQEAMLGLQHVLDDGVSAFGEAGVNCGPIPSRKCDPSIQVGIRKKF